MSPSPHAGHTPSPRSSPPPSPLSRVGFLKVVMIPMFLPVRMSLAPLPSKVSGRQGHRQVWQEGSMLLQRRDSRPGLWYPASYRQRCLIEQGHQDEGPAPTKDPHQPQAGGTPPPWLRGDQSRDVRDGAGGDGLFRFTPDAQQPQ